ncbi:MAG: hypothetical protein M3R47_17655 [Chloroflexota bacterium]|nr:hypothetical protein [Chloroflexota bacterium]
MAGRKKKLKVEEVVEALRQSRGLKTGAAELLDVAYNTIERYIADSAEAKAVIEHYRIRRRDRAEYKLDEAIERGESWSIMFTLKNAKDREYSERVDVNQTGDMRVIIEYADSEDNPAKTTPGPEADQE